MGILVSIPVMKLVIGHILEVLLFRNALAMRRGLEIQRNPKKDKLGRGNELRESEGS